MNILNTTNLSLTSPSTPLPGYVTVDITLYLSHLPPDAETGAAQFSLSLVFSYLFFHSCHHCEMPICGVSIKIYILRTPVASLHKCWGCISINKVTSTLVPFHSSWVTSTRESVSPEEEEVSATCGDVHMYRQTGHIPTLSLAPRPPFWSPLCS